MYKYDIPFPKKDQYTLYYEGFPINVAKSVSYLKTKMKAHRDDMGSENPGSYSIVAPDGGTVYTRVFEKGEEGNSTTPYHVIGPKPVYKTVYMYDAAEPLTETRRENEFPIITYDAICGPDGAVVTDLKLLKILSDMLYRERFPVMVTRRALVSMATYKPQDKASFVQLSGAGEKLYEKCGERFIKAIKDYLAES